MYDLLNDNAGRERHKAFLAEVESERLARQVEKHSAQRGIFAQVRNVIIKSLSGIIR